MEKLRLRGGAWKTDQGTQARIPTQGLTSASVPSPLPVLGAAGVTHPDSLPPSPEGAVPSQVSGECLGTFLHAPPGDAWKAGMGALSDRHQRGPPPAPSPQSLSHSLMPSPLPLPCSRRPHQGLTALCPFLFLAAPRPTCPRVPKALRSLS